MSHQPIISDQDTVRSMIERRAVQTPDHVYLRFGEQALTCAELDARVNQTANLLAESGVRAGERVAVMLRNSLDAVYAFFALAKLGAVQVPVNIQLRGQTLHYLLKHSEPALLVTERYFDALLTPAIPECVTKVIHCDDRDWQRRQSTASNSSPPGCPKASDLSSILYTSGTTGPPKGVLVTDKMHRAAAWASAVVADVRAGDVMYLWEPLYHVTGTEVLIVGLEHEVTLALTERFSASRFWPDVGRYGVTLIHYVGGVLQILLKGPAGPQDERNSVRVAWGGGAPSHLWERFAQRFDIRIRENYGMTETSSLTTMNLEGKHGAVGRPAEFFEVCIRNTDGDECEVGQTGEICVREREPGLITEGYFRNPDATAAALREGWFYTGDLGRVDEDGFVYYRGRLKDSLRRRGENVSAFEVERIVEQLPWVRECALIGVPDELGDETLKLLVSVVEDETPDASDLAAWCREQLGRFQVPEYIQFIDEFPKTSTQRIQKEKLDKSTVECWQLTIDGVLSAPD